MGEFAMCMSSLLRGLVLVLAVVAQATVASAVVIPLGNLFDDPKLTPLATAITSDTFAATGDATDLGVQTVIDGGLNVPVVIAPGITFDFSNAGGSAGGAFGDFRNDSAYNAADANEIVRAWEVNA